MRFATFDAMLAMSLFCSRALSGCSNRVAKIDHSASVENCVLQSFRSVASNNGLFSISRAVDQPESRPQTWFVPKPVRPEQCRAPFRPRTPFRRTTTERLLRRGLRLMSCLVHAEARREADCLRYGGDLLSMWRHHS